MPHVTSLIDTLPFEFKMVLLGQSQVGKTCIVLKYVKGQFFEFSAATIGASFLSKSVLCKNQTVHLQIWDTAGQERFRSMAPLYYRGAEGAIVAYDITDYGSFENAKTWVRTLKNEGPEDIVIALVGNKNDQSDLRCVDVSTAKSYAESEKLLFFECSAKTGENINEIFQAVADTRMDKPDMLENSASRHDETRIHISDMDGTTKKGNCDGKTKKGC